MRIERESGAAAWLAYAGTRTASAPGVMALSESSQAGNQKASLASLPLKLHPFRHLEGPLAWGPSLLSGTCQAHRGAPLTGVLLCRSVRQAFDGAASLLFSCGC